MPVKVAHICAVPSSLKFLLSDQMRYLEEQGYEIHAISSPGPYQDDIIEQLDGRWYPARISRSISPLDDLRGVWDVARVCARERFDIVHTHTPKGTLLGQLGAHLGRVPIVIQTLHGFYFIALEEGSLSRRLVHALETFTCRATSELVLSQNAEDVARLLREGVCGPDKAQVLGNGIDISRFKPRDFDDDELRRRREAVGLKPDGPVLGIVGRYVLGKGYRELCEAVQLLAPRYPTLQVLAIGARPTSERPEEVFLPDQDPIAGERFVCLYDRQDMEELYRLMDLFVLPSWREGMPRSSMEASATGLAVVTTDVRGCRETVTHDDNGLLVEVRNSRLLAEAIAALLDDPERREAMGRRGLQLARDEFDQQVVFRRVADSYAALLKRHVRA